MKRGFRNAIFALAGLVVLIVVLFATSVVSIKIDLPPAAPTGPVIVAIRSDGPLTVDGTPTTLDTLTQDVSTRFAGVAKDQQRIMIRAPGDVKYDHFMDVQNRLGAHGWTKIGLIRNSATEAEPEPEPGSNHGQH